MNKHEIKNLSHFLDTKKGADPRWSQIQVRSWSDGENGLMACDGKMMAVMSDYNPLLFSSEPYLILDGAGFCKQLAASPDSQVTKQEGSVAVKWEGETTLYQVAPIPEGGGYVQFCYSLTPPEETNHFGFFAPHAATLGKIKTGKGKPAVIQLTFRGSTLSFTAIGSLIRGVGMANSLPKEEQ